MATGRRGTVYLANYRIEALDINDVVLSKLKRCNNDDRNDIRAMAATDRIDHKRLIARFEAAADWFSMDARADEVQRYLDNLRSVERDILDVPPGKVHLPDSMLDD